MDWQRGPTKATMKSTAEIQVPEGYMFTGPKGTKIMLEAMGNPTGGRELGLLAPTNLHWFVVFEFNDTGYVKDDDKDKLDPDKMLAAFKKANEYGNEQRRKMGAAALNITGWEQQPKYNEETHNLEWAIRAESEGSPIVNYNTRLLGRKGVMEVSLVVEPDKLSATLPTYQGLLKDYSFTAGETYAEYRKGDKLAQYGLAALITGGAVAVAAKTGLLTAFLLFFKKAWKLLIVGVVAVFSFFKRLIFGRGARSDTSADGQ